MGRPAKPMIPPPSAEDDCASGALSIRAAGAFAAGVSRTTIKRAIDRGEIETFRIGGRVAIARREMVRWLASYLEAARRASALERARTGEI